MKITLGILLLCSVLLNIFFAGYLFLFSPESESTSPKEVKRVSYEKALLNDEQLKILKIRTKYQPEIQKILLDYHDFIRDIKDGKKSVIVEDVE